MATFFGGVRGDKGYFIPWIYIEKYKKLIYSTELKLKKLKKFFLTFLEFFMLESNNKKL
jgi:hypothetical protein